MSLANVVGVSRGIKLGWVTVHTWPFMSDVFAVVGWSEVAGFDDRCHVNRGGRVSS